MKTNNCAPVSSRSLVVGLVAVAMGVAANTFAQSPPALDELCRTAVSTDRITAEHAIRTLRDRGPEGLQALLATHAAAIRQHAAAPVVLFAPPKPDESWLRLRAALDGVSQQRDCYASQLFWHTDIEQAKTAAQAQGKPILSLRMLGKLDEEFSCANSRFFRTTLYANAEVAKYLREYFVLHWKSVRPVPRVTIDFGDGRKLERTITGNSIHYVLSPDGEVMDALPGLYGAKAFLRGLQRAEEVTQQAVATLAEERRAVLASYHRSRVAALNAELEQDLQQVSLAPAVFLTTSSFASVGSFSFPPAAQAAARITTSKSWVETPILKGAIVEPPGSQRGGRNAIDDATWQKIAALHAEDAALDRGAKALIRAKGPNAIEASRVALSKSFVEDPMLRKMRSMERSISEDTVRNEYLLHRQIHEWLASNAAPPVDTLNARVYAELFLTPDSDPWLGLLPADAYAALENDGLSLTAKQ